MIFAIRLLKKLRKDSYVYKYSFIKGYKKIEEGIFVSYVNIYIINCITADIEL